MIGEPREGSRLRDSQGQTGCGTMVCVIATSRHGVTEGPTGGLVGDVGMEGHQIRPYLITYISSQYLEVITDT